jgi:hypothetical protein
VSFAESLQPLVERAFSDFWKRCQPGYEDSLRDVLEKVGFDVDIGAFDEAFPPRGKTEAEMKDACETVREAGEAGLMAVHVVLNHVDRANLIGAAPSVTYSSIGNIARNKFLVHMVSIVQDMADEELVVLDSVHGEVDNCYALPPPPEAPQAEVRLSYVFTHTLVYDNQ